MKKMTDKGFMMVEAIIVSTFVVSVLIFLFVQFKNINYNYEKSFSYNNINNTYAVNNIKIYLQKFLRFHSYSSIEDLDYFENNSSLYLYPYVLDGEVVCHSEFSQNDIKDNYCRNLMKSLNVENVFIVKESSNMYVDYNSNSDLSEKLKEYLASINNDPTSTNYRIIVEFKDETYSNLLIINDRI